MIAYQEFLSSLLPGNYALTKSMELSKIRSSGTLWYMKKFLVLYYYVFLSNEITTLEYKEHVIRAFDSYINSLHEDVRSCAEAFFYPDNEAINLKSDNFTLFMNFAGQNVFATQADRERYYQRAKKLYFTLLMGSGGQTGVKLRLKAAISTPGFVYSTDHVNEAILRSAIDSLVNDANHEHRVKDNSIKYVLSSEVIREALLIAERQPVSIDDVLLLDSEHPNIERNNNLIESDLSAFIRNERQVLYYYGYFHSKSSGSADFEFSSLTPVGELALSANASEFLAIWEHQKIKMVSQPMTVEINNIPHTRNNPAAFGVSFTPYTDILGHLLRRSHLSLDEYKYVVSRKKACIDEDAWETDEPLIFSNLHAIKERIDSFHRTRDTQDEDGRKELLKYLLGIRCDLPVDAGTNPLNIVRYTNSLVTVNSHDALFLLYDIYSRLDKYKISKYHEVLVESENDLRLYYTASLNGTEHRIDHLTKIKWDLYNIHVDKLILLGSMFAISAVSLGMLDLERMTEDGIRSIASNMFTQCGGLLAGLGIRSQTAVYNAVRAAYSAIVSGDYTRYLNDGEDDREQVIAQYREENAEALQTRIIQISNEATVVRDVDRTRNSQLVSMLKSYYMLVYSMNHMLTCECCGEQTFTTGAGEPYVEFHHLIPFNIALGPDHYLNLFALCPNCHRKLYYQNLADKHLMYTNLSNGNYARLRFAQRLRELKNQRILRSYHLEYLLADCAITADEYNEIIA